MTKLKTILSITSAVGLVAITAALGAPSAAAVPGSPGVPQVPTDAYVETFQTKPPTTANNTAIPIGNYSYTDSLSGASRSYSADPAWTAGAGACNGWVLNMFSTTPGDGCGSATNSNGGRAYTNAAATNYVGQSSWWFLKGMAVVIGVGMGMSDPSQNNAIASQTNRADTTQAAGYQFIADNLVNTVPGHYYAVAADFAEAHCPPPALGGISGWTDSRETLYMIVDGVPQAVMGDGTVAGGISTCQKGALVRVPANIPAPTDSLGANTTAENNNSWHNHPYHYLHLVSNPVQAQASGIPLGLMLYNARSSGNGDDSAFDNPRILDVTPQLDKSFDPKQIPAGGASTLTFTITNTDDLRAKTGWQFTDNLPANLTIVPGSATTDCPNGAVTPSSDGTSVSVTGDMGDGMGSCTASVKVTSTVVGSYLNDSTNITGAWGLEPPAGDTLKVVSNPAMTLVKTPTLTSSIGLPKSTITTAGDKVDYAMVVTNTGDVPINYLTVTDPPADFSGTGSLSGISCSPVAQGGTLPVAVPGTQTGITTCRMSYVVTQADLDSGATQLTNTATATGTGLGSFTPTVVQDDAQVPIGPLSAHLTLDKSANVTVAAVGTAVTYSFLVTNDGHVTISNLVIDETTFTGRGAAPVPSCPVTTLAPGASTTCTATYSPTQADVDAGSVNNTAVERGTDPQNQPVASNPDSVSLTSTPNPKLQLVKSASSNALTVGNNVTYQFQVTNSGNVTVTNLTIAEGVFTGHGTLGTVTCPVTTLAPGAATTCTAPYTVVQADVDQLLVHNTATAKGKSPTGSDVISNEDFTDLTGADNHSIQLVKSGVPDTVSAVGQTVTYTFAVTNSGNVTVENVAIEELEFTGSEPIVDMDIACAATTLAPGESTDCTETYVTTQADLDRGTIYNEAKAVATDSHGHDLESNTDDFTVTATQVPTLGLVKSVVANGPAKAGTSVTYSFLVTNTGNVTLNNLTVNDAGPYTNTSTPGFSGMNTMSPITCPVTTLAPGAQTTCTATYALHQADVNAGVVNNTAQAQGFAPGAGTPTLSNPSAATLTLGRSPALTLTKSVAIGGTAKVGSTLTYSFLVTNTGNVTLTNLTVNDAGVWVGPTVPGFSGSGTLPTIVCPLRMLAPNQSTTCLASAYTLTQADVDAGVVHNTAVAEAQDPPGDPVDSNPSTIDVNIPSAPALALVKTVTPAGVSTAGDSVTYSFFVRNTGNVTVNTLDIQETAFSGTGTMSAVTCPVTSLASNATTTCTATYAVTQADIDAGEVTNTATATGKDPGGANVTSNPDDATVTASATPDIGLVKTASPSAYLPAPGGTLSYTFVVTNTGGTTLNNVTVAETAFSPGLANAPTSSCPKTTLLPNESMTCTAAYTVTQADADYGYVTNTATATGTPPSGPPVTASDSANVPENASPALTLVKSVSPQIMNAAGDVVTYSFLVTNSGNVTVHGITINDFTFTGSGSLGTITCPDTLLIPLASTTCTATYAVTQADIDAGNVHNVAVASGLDPHDASVVSNESVADVDTTASPALTLAKSVSPTTVHVAGDSVTYSFLVTNSGNVTVKNLAIDDFVFTGTGARSPIPCPVTTLLPNASTTCTATYAVTQADVDAGEVDNTARATGTDPGGAEVLSNNDTAVLTATPGPELTLVKSADRTELVAGQTVTYSFAVTNSGNVTVDNVAIDEGAFTGHGTLGAATCADRLLIPGASTICTATYVVTQTDVDSRSVMNTATATGTDPKGDPVVSNPDTHEITQTVPSALTLAKSVTPVRVLAAGDSVTYSFLVTNTGPVTITDLVINETHFTGTGTVSAISCPVTTLAPGAYTTCTATYAATQADINHHDVENTATASGTDPAGDPVVSQPADADFTAPDGPSLELVKSADRSGLVAGQTVTYSFLVTNAGNNSIHDVAIVEGAFNGHGTLGAATCPPGVTLQPNESTTCTATYVVTQADVDAGWVNNSATATGLDPDDHPVVSEPDYVDIYQTSVADLTLEKSVAPTTVSAAGDAVTWSFLVTNSGPVTVTNLAITEGTFTGTGTMGTITCPLTTLNPGASTTCTATYAATQADVDAGRVDNTATAIGKDPIGGDVVSDPSSAAFTVPNGPALSLVKSADRTGLVAGQTVTYSFLVTNTGNVTVSNVAIDEGAFTGHGTLGAATCPDTTLVPGASTTCTATYVVTQADVDAGTVENTATATGTDPSDEPVVSPPDSHEITQTSVAALTLVKSVDPSTVSAAGDSVTYSFLVTNTGPVTVTDVAITETAFTGTGTMSAISCPVTTLAPLASTTCTATYAVTQADVDAGQVDNTATAAGIDPGGASVVSGPSSATVTATPGPALTLDKSADRTGLVAGQTVTYSFLVTNTGNVTVKNVAIAEGAFTGHGTLGAATCPDTTLAPLASTTCTATYVVTQSDVDAGTVENTATATGLDPDDQPVVSPPDTVEITQSSTAALTLVKSVAPTTVLAAGDSVTYSFLVTNSGPVTVTDLAISEGSFTGTGTMSAISCPVTTLAPLASTTCTATYAVTQADVDAGLVDNTATATGKDPGGNPVVSGPSQAEVTVPTGPALSLVKSADRTGLVAGQTVTYSFLVTNTGNVTVTNVAIDEGAFTGHGTLGAATCPDTTLVPGASTTCTATYVVTQADVDAGTVENTATATGTDPTDAPVVSPPDTHEITQPAGPHLSLVKTASTDTLVAGDDVTYSFAVTNDGNVTLSDLTINEVTFTGSHAMGTVSCPVTTLAPTDTTTCTATYSVTQADVDAGQVDNTATATGTVTTTGADVTSDPSSASLTGDTTASLKLVKSADKSTVAAGDAVVYSFEVTNTGKVTLKNIQISENTFSGKGTLGAIDCPVTELAPLASVVCTADYTVVQGDVDQGSVDNTARASGVAPDSTSVLSNQSTARLTSDQTPGLSLVKSATPTNMVAGQLVTYSFVVTNTGNETVDNVKIVEGAFTGSGTMSAATCADTTLAPLASTTCTAKYTPTQQDVDQGTVDNTATAAGTDPGGAAVTSEPSSATITATPDPKLALVKTVTPNTTAALTVGTLLTYNFAVTNTGNLTLTDLKINDGAGYVDATTPGFSGTGHLSAIGCMATTLVPGAATTCSATYLVTLEDVNAGILQNTAVATGTPPGGKPPIDSPPSTTTVSGSPLPAIGLTKTHASITSTPRAGNPVTFVLEATNTGNVTLTNVHITDDLLGATVTCPASWTAWPGAAGVLDPGQKVTCSAAYNLTQADIDAGTVHNTATAIGTPPSGSDVTDPATDDVPLGAEPTIGLVKTADKSTLVVGDNVTYSFKVTNTGNVTLTNVAIAEGAFNGHGTLGAATCPVTTLAPGADTTCTATYTVLQADVDAGVLDNTATATGTGGGVDVVSPPSSAHLTATSGPAVTLLKTADKSSVAKGDNVTFSFLITNTGNVSLSDLKVNEVTFTGSGTLSSIDCPVTTLAPTVSTTCTATYTVTQADVNAGGFLNTATATGTAATTGQKVTSDPSTVPLTAPQTPSLGLTKSADKTELVVGQTITYTFVVTNNGNVPVTGVAIVEGTFTGTGTLSAAKCAATTLATGEETTCTATYVVTQADVDSGQLHNEATAKGTIPGGTDITSPPAEADVPETPQPGLSLDKTADKTTLVVGEPVVYSFKVTNNGNVTVSGLRISDNVFDGKGVLGTITCPVTTLGPKVSTVCTATYVPVQEDIDQGSVTNTATAKGTPAGSSTEIPSNDSTAKITAPDDPKLGLVKSADQRSLVAGSTITYSFVVTNLGNETVTNLAIKEGTFTGSGTLGAATCPVTTLAPGASTTCTATYDKVSQADVDAGKVSNTATATGKDPMGDDVTSPPSSTDVTATPAPRLALVKSVSPNTPSALSVDNVLTYSFAVTNTGNVTVSSLVVKDGGAYVDTATPGFSGSGTMSAINCPVTSLAPGESTTCTSTYTVTLDDVNAGKLLNTAVASGKTPKDATVDSPPKTVTVSGTAWPAIDMVKTHDALSGTAAAGQQVTFKLQATNTGNVTLTGVTVTDSLRDAPVNCPASAWPGAVGVLNPGEQVICTATYTLHQSDVDAGRVDNTGTATGRPPTGPDVTDDGQDHVDLVAAPGLKLEKSADTPDLVVGHQVTYSFKATNTGNVTLTGLTINEGAFTGHGKLGKITCPVDTLVPGASTTCTATYTVTQADVDATQVNNTATAVGTDPSDKKVPSGPSSAVLNGTGKPAIALAKVHQPLTGRTVAGQTVQFQLTVTNSGPLTLTDVTVNDTLRNAGPVTCPAAGKSWPAVAGTLAPGEQVICSTTYVLTQDDLDHGGVVNTATASGKDPSNKPVTSDATDPVDVTPAPALTIVKTADRDRISAANQAIVYSFLVTNTGTVTVKDVAVSEEAFSGTAGKPAAVCPKTTLAPGESMTCKATYITTQADMDAAAAQATPGLDNTARATGNTVDDKPVKSDPATKHIPVLLSPALTLEKVASLTGDFVPNAAVTYGFIITNTGNTTLTNVTVNETIFTGSGKLSDVTCNGSTTLVPGDVLTCQATYVVTQADVDRGSVDNTAVATGIQPATGAKTISPPAQATIPAHHAPGIKLIKTATMSGGQIRYTYEVTNVGNVTVTSLTITEAFFNGTGNLPTPVCEGDGTLRPGESTTCTTTYLLTSADIGKKITNVGKATGQTPDGVVIDTHSTAATKPGAQPGTGGTVVSLDSAAGSAQVALAALLLSVITVAFWWRERRNN